VCEGEGSGRAGTWNTGCRTVSNCALLRLIIALLSVSFRSRDCEVKEEGGREKERKGGMEIERKGGKEGK
jgi:hypothetical protein